EDLKIIFESGATQVNVGSLAVRNRSLFLNWLKTYGGEKLILSADVRNQLIAISGWQEQTELSVGTFIGDYMTHGVQRAVVTDIARDGMLQGPSFGLYRELLGELPSLKLVASGGITTLHDLDQLHTLGLDGAIIGKAIYEGRMSLSELQTWSEGKS
ncbi:MAG: HisA/HisF-related TIM barrel protein, partial [Bacteroidota bacterium]